MMDKVKKNAPRIDTFPGDQTESEWLRALEFLRASLSEALSTHALLGFYSICDFPGYASASGMARLRSGAPVPGIHSDSWEGVLCWSGNRGEGGHASALIFPFLDGSAVQPQGRIADSGPDAKVDSYLLYQFEINTFVDAGWIYEDGPGEWAYVSTPNTVYWRTLMVHPLATTIESGKPIHVDITIPALSDIRTNSKTTARISLIHVNRNRERTNLVPWTAKPPESDSTKTLSLSNATFPASKVIRIRLDSFNIRGGWIPGNYHLSIRVQNFHKPTDSSWTSELSQPFKLTII